MNTSAEVVLTWGDSGPDGFLFALKGKQIEHLEKARNAGIQEIAERIFNGRWYLQDLRMTVQLALEGGGMPPVHVADKMTRFFDGQPLSRPGDPSSPLATAQAVMSAAFFGMEDIKTDTGEPKPGQARPKKSTSANGGRRSSKTASTRARSKQ